MSSETALLRQLFNVAVAAVHPSQCLPSHLPPPPSGRTVVCAAGKAAASMAQTVEQHWPGELSGLAVTRYGHKARCRQIEVVEASHPIPDATGIQAAQRMIDLVTPLGREDLVLVLISGGGSALLTLPAEGVSGPLPTILMPHGGPFARDEWGFDFLAQFLASQGYAVLQSNYRGSSGFGDEWEGDGAYKGWKRAITS